MRIGVLTGGGDCPGLNAAIRAIVLDATPRQSQVVGLLEGWRGAIEGNTREITRDQVRGILRQWLHAARASRLKRGWQRVSRQNRRWRT